jgi:hypothetical protein
MGSEHLPLDIERHRSRRRRWPVFVAGVVLGVLVGLSVCWQAGCA